MITTHSKYAIMSVLLKALKQNLDYSSKYYCTEENKNHQIKYLGATKQTFYLENFTGIIIIIFRLTQKWFWGCRKAIT